MTAPLYITDRDVESTALTAVEVADALAGALRQRLEGQVAMPTKSSLSCVGSDAFFHAMPAVVPGMAAGVKWAAGSPSNTGRGLPHVHALLVLSDTETGEMIAVIEAGYLTGLRTAALSLLAARSLAKPDATTLGLIGCGLQARTHLDAFAAEFPLRSVAVYGRMNSSMDTFARSVAQYGLKPVLCDRPVDALRCSDIVVTTVPAQRGLTGFLDANTLPEGAFVSMVDLGRSWDAGTVAAFDRCLTDDREQSHALAQNNPAFAAMRFSGDLGELMAGRVDGRQNDRERLALLFPGIALADIVAGHLLVARHQPG